MSAAIESEKRIAEIYENITKIHFSERNMFTEDILRDLYTEVRFLRQQQQKEADN